MFSQLNSPPRLYPCLRFTEFLAVAAQDSGPSGSLVLSRKNFAFSTSYRFIPAHKNPHSTQNARNGVLSVTACFQHFTPLWYCHAFRSRLFRVKQIFFAALVSVALPVFGLAQDGAAIQLKSYKACGGNSTAGCACGGNSTVGCVMPPQQTRAPKAKYPEKERKARHEGIVTLGVIVGSDGEPRDISVLSSLSPDFDKAAIDALKQWKFSPATKDGKPVAVKIAVQVDFHLH